jgi:hypothetical protein
MLDYLQPLKTADVDVIMFFEGSKPDSIKIEGTQYEDRGVPVGGNDLGNAYHIMLCKDHPTEDKYHQFDEFEAILAEPLEYISGLIPSGWYGVIARKTTTSTELVNRVLANFQNHL